MAREQDSIVERAQRVHRSFGAVSDPRRVQVALGGPCPDCGERVEIVLHPDSSRVTCTACGGSFSIDG